ncbi:MAG: hypothetical protein DMF63_06205 [Acidobacteria bacterium]|nr:MAG: hypothetical protein DMF63_06205 [Acidobacteriota bacterium]
MQLLRSILVLAVAAIFLGSAVLAQTKKRTKPPEKTPVVATVPTPSPSPEPVTDARSPKKNERPGTGSSTTKNSAPPATIATEPTYFYEFAQPDFDIKKIVIQHDEAGVGTIMFIKRMFGDAVTDPINVSRETMDRINAAYAALNFLDSTENYQYEKDYAHLGVMTFRLKRGDKQRMAMFNYTTNADAKALADEYRKLGNQFIWVFDISVARENQPLEAPKLLDALDSQMRRNEISDPAQLVPLLKSMIDDERLPLIARNHAGKLAERIGKGKK